MGQVPEAQRQPERPVELRRLGRTLKGCAPDVLAYFDRPPHIERSQRGEAINDRLEHLRVS